MVLRVRRRPNQYDSRKNRGGAVFSYIAGGTKSHRSRLPWLSVRSEVINRPVSNAGKYHDAFAYRYLAACFWRGKPHYGVGPGREGFMVVFIPALIPRDEVGRNVRRRFGGGASRALPGAGWRRIMR